MKIVIDRSEYGFSLSCAALKMLADLNGLDFFVYEEKCYDDDTYAYERLSAEEVSTRCREVTKHGHSFYFTKDCGEILEYPDQAAHQLYSIKRYVHRDDENVIRVVETLGEAANGMSGFCGDQLCELKIVEIPDGVDWEVVYEWGGCEVLEDGPEIVREKFRVWK